MGIDVMTLLLLWTAKDEWNYSYQDTKTDENTNDIVTTSFRREFGGRLLYQLCAATNSWFGPEGGRKRMDTTILSEPSVLCLYLFGYCFMLKWSVCILVRVEIEWSTRMVIFPFQLLFVLSMNPKWWIFKFIYWSLGLCAIQVIFLEWGIFLVWGEWFSARVRF